MHPRANSDIEVARLKELLFDEEQRTLDHLGEVVQRHNARIGTDDRLAASVSAIIAEALRQADVKQHRELAAAVSPLVVSGIKREIRNSRDEMVDALYPIMGRLISAYVRTAVRDMMEQTNARLESGLSGRFLRLRLKSLLTGRPYRELALKEGGRLRIEELLLIRRSDGVMIDRWQALSMGDAKPEGEDVALLGGMLSAINDFAREALSGSNDELRSLETGEARIYLRSSPGHLLAVKCTGTAGRRTERAIGSALLEIIEDRAEVLAAADDPPGSASIKSVLPAAAERLTETLDAEKGGRPVLAIALVSGVLLGLAGLLGWHLWHESQLVRLASRVESLIKADAAFEGYPVATEVAGDRSSVTVSGFAPSETDARRLSESIGAAIRPVRLEARLTSVPTVADYRRRTSDLLALAEQLRQVEADLGGLAAREDVAGLARQMQPLEERLAGLETVSAGLADLKGEVGRLRTAMAGLAAKETAEALSGDVAALSARIGGLDERIAALPFAGQLQEQGRLTADLKAELAALAGRLDDPEGALLTLLARQAVFFETGLALRDRAGAERFLAEAAALARRTSAGLRVVGYTDAMGTPEANIALGLARARAVIEMLVAAGMPRERLVPVSRANTVRIASDQAGGAPSERRVELEAAFQGELSLPNGTAP